jgi:Family of unknown function (DUF6527)
VPLFLLSAVKRSFHSTHIPFRVYMPKQLEPGILYVSEKYGTAAHHCAYGCGAKIRTPLGPTEWSVKEAVSGLDPERRGKT